MLGGRTELRRSFLACMPLFDRRLGSSMHVRCDPWRQVEVVSGVGRTVVLASACAGVAAAVWFIALESGSDDQAAAALAAIRLTVMTAVLPWLVTCLTLAILAIVIVLLHDLADAICRSFERVQAREPVRQADAQPPRTQTHALVARGRAAIASAPVERPTRPRAECGDNIVFQIAYERSGKIIWTYPREGAALGFVRDVVRLASHAEAAQFELRLVHRDARTYTIARGEQLVRRAVEDQVL